MNNCGPESKSKPSAEKQAGVKLGKGLGLLDFLLNVYLVTCGAILLVLAIVIFIISVGLAFVWLIIATVLQMLWQLVKFK